jgi:K+-sensing histidine kinase KdpD
MGSDPNSRRVDAEVARLEAENRSLQQQISALQISNQTLWIVLAEIARRLQGHSTSIKAAVSSLLDYDIFWDESTQHEFLETINSSVDGISALTAVLTLAFKVEARNLEIKREPAILQEILVTTATALAESSPPIQLELSMPSAGKSVLVDYEYLAVALRLLFRVLLQSGGISPEKIGLEAVEAEKGWQLLVGDVEEPVIDMICDAFHHRSDHLLPPEQLLPEDSLRLLTACKIFQLQQVAVNKQEVREGKSRLQLIVPFG